MKRTLGYLLVALLFTGLGVWAGARFSTPARTTAGHEHAAGEERGERRLYTCGMHPNVIQDHPGSCPICGMKLMPLKGGGAAAATEGGAPPKAKGKRKIKYWVAPMNPTYIRDAPGKSPMGMDLVPVYEDEDEAAKADTHPSAIRIDPSVVQNMGVRTATVERRDLTRTLRTIGHVTEDETRLTEVNTKVGGWIEELYVSETGQQVKRGDPLLTLYAPDLVTTQREYLLALNNLRKVKRSPFPEVVQGARRLLSSARERLALWDITPAQIDRLERTGKVERTLTLYSPFDGVVLKRHVVEGAYAKPGQPLLKLADLSTVWVLADVYEQELPWVQPGTPADMTLTYHPGQVFHGRLDYIYPTLNPKTRVVQVRLIFKNADLTLKPGMYADVTMTPRVAAQVVVVPKEAVIHSGRRNLAFVRLDDGRFEPRTLTLGPQGDDGYQVLAGLIEGETVVTSAQFLLDSESQLKEAINKLLKVRKQQGTTRAEGVAPTKGMEGMKGMKMPAAPAPAAARDAFSAYLKIQAALAGDRAASAATVEGLRGALGRLAQQPASGVTPAELRRLSTDLDHLKSGDLQVARGGFGPVSELMLALARGSEKRVAAELGLKAFHCPMSHANWLQRGQVANPYFGAPMLRCGEPLSGDGVGEK